MDSSNIKRFWNTAPILFPFAALFHIVILISSIYTLYPTPITQIDWIRPLLIFVYTSLSIFICNLNKKAALAYIILTLLTLTVAVYSGFGSDWGKFAEALVPINLIISIFILVYYKKFK
jgi:hypothetical protein